MQNITMHSHNKDTPMLHASIFHVGRRHNIIPYLAFLATGARRLGGLNVVGCYFIGHGVRRYKVSAAAEL